MEKYNYYEAMKTDVKAWLEDNEWKINAEEYKNDKDGFCEWLQDQMWACDSVTGNGSGSYTFCAWEAEENLCHNLDLLADACEDFGSNMDILKDGAEACDVTIRCYLLGSTIAEVIDEMWEESEEE